MSSETEITEIRDYNGQGRWSRESVETRFNSYSKRFGTTIDKLQPRVHKEGSVKWIYPLAEAIAEGIENKDPACMELGVELIETSDSMPFGMILKSNAARAIRRNSDLLTPDQKDRIRKRVAEMLISEYMPREFLQYVNLARQIGFGDQIARVESEADLNDRWVSHYLDKLRGGR